MSVFQQPLIVCIVCVQTVHLADVTAGSLYADGSQAFACNTHLRDHIRWVIVWAAFDAIQMHVKQSNSVARDTA